jgi:hypothetical protein
MSNKIPGNVESMDCDLKCQYTMFYVNDKYTIANNDDSIILSSQPPNSKSVSYASGIYTLQNITIVKEAVHTFSGSVVGEIIITHKLANSGTLLNVCIPIQIGPPSIIDSIIKAAPNRMNDIKTTSPEFSLIDIIPINTFYNYTSESNIITIVFDSSNSLTITDDTNTTIFQPKITTSFIPGNNYLYNENELFKSINPPINGALSNDIVIDCTAINDGSYEDALIHKHASTDTGGSIMSPETIAFWWSILTALMIVALLVLVSVFVNKENLNTMTNAAKI